MNIVHTLRQPAQAAPAARQPLNRPQRAWFQHALPWLVARRFLGRVTLHGASHIPATGPVLFVARHRAGIMDGWAYAHALPRPTTFLLAARLRRNPVMRLLVAGIAVARRQDGGDPAANRRRNAAALATARSELAAGRTILVFPEGTSSLGPRHLPFEPGAALLARACPGATIIPLAIDYIGPTRIGTDVEITAGPPLNLPPCTPAEAIARLTAALEATAPDVPDATHQWHAEAAARSAWRRGLSYAAALRNLPPQPLPAPPGSRLRRVIRTAAVILNAPPCWAAHAAGRTLADADNTILPWSVIVGLPAAILWAAALPATLLLAGHPWPAAAYAALTALDLAWPNHA